MAKLISDLKLGDKVFVINKPDCTFDIAEVIELSSVITRFQCYLSNETFYLWKSQESKRETVYQIVFTDEIEALEELRRILK